MFPSKGNKLLCPYLWKEIQSQNNLASCKDVSSTKKGSFGVKRKTFWLCNYFYYLLHSFPYQAHMLGFVYLSGHNFFPVLRPWKKPQFLLCASLSHFERQATALLWDYHSGFSLGLPTKLVKLWLCQPLTDEPLLAVWGVSSPPSLGQASPTLIPKTPWVQLRTLDSQQLCRQPVIGLTPKINSSITCMEAVPHAGFHSAQTTLNHSNIRTCHYDRGRNWHFLTTYKYTGKSHLQETDKSFLNS